MDRKMKIKSLTVCLISFIAALILSVNPVSYRAYAEPIDLEPSETQKQVSVLILSILEKYHYEKITLDDSLSSIIFDQYIQGFDNNKLYFYQSDIDSFEKYRYKLDDAILVGDLNPAYEIFNVFFREKPAMMLINLRNAKGETYASSLAKTSIASLLPSFIAEPLPNARSICARAASSAF